MPEVRKDITKEEVVRREINTAILMQFSNMDAISTHVVASAAYEIIHVICDQMGIVTLTATLESKLKGPEAANQLRKIRKTPYHFFKHAKKDAAKQLEHFDERATDLLILEAGIAYQLAYKQITLPIAIYRGWIATCYPRVFRDEPGMSPIHEVFPDMEAKSRTQQKAAGMKALTVVGQFDDKQVIDLGRRMGMNVIRG